MNPPCYRCTSEMPLPIGQVGMCLKCSTEVEAASVQKASVEFCPKCGITFYNDWERIQHLVNQRHNYRAWTPEEGKRNADKLANRNEPRVLRLVE